MAYRVTRRRPDATLLVVVAILSTQIGSATAKGLFPSVGPTGAVALRIGIGALLMLVITRPRITGYHRNDWLWLARYAAVLMGMNWCFYQAISRLPIGVAVTVEFVGPLAVVIGTSRKALDALWGLLAGAGVLTLGLGGQITSVTGLLFVLAAATCWAGFILTTKRVGQIFPGAQALTLGLVLASVVVVPAGAITTGGKLLTAHALLGGLAIASLSTALPYSLELIALRSLPASVFGVLLSLEPASAALAGFVLLGEKLNVHGLIGIALVSLASLGATLSDRRAAAAEVAPPG